jgi:uncharacterized membrane protein
MSELWLVIAGLAVGSAVIRSAGPVLLGGRDLHPRVLRVIALLAPAVLAALVVTQAFEEDGELVWDTARLVALGAAGVALALRVNLLVAVGVAAATAALLRALS